MDWRVSEVIPPLALPTTPISSLIAVPFSEPQSGADASFLETSVGPATLVLVRQLRRRQLHLRQQPPEGHTLRHPHKTKSEGDALVEEIELNETWDECVQLLDNTVQVALDEQVGGGGCEVLYGRAGLLYALLFLRAELSAARTALAQTPHDRDRVIASVIRLSSDANISALVNDIIQRGITGAKLYKDELDDEEKALAPPLMWSWHGKRYLGAAHGVAGILQMLISCPLRALSPHWPAIVETVQWLLAIQNPLGNWPTKAGKYMCQITGGSAVSKEAKRVNVGEEDEEELIQWCHGAPGVLILLSTFLQRASHSPSLELPSPLLESIIAALKRGGELVYARGLLRKGVGLCHGVAGSVYALLAVSDALDKTLVGTQGRDHVDENDAYWLLRAVHLADLAAAFQALTQKGQMSVPDRPYSLYEGIGGMCCAWAEVVTRLGAAKGGLPPTNPDLFEDGGNTLVSAMMLFLGNEEKVYILDKAEGNAAQVEGRPAWGAVYDIASRQAEVMPVVTNVFCASGMHMPNGSYATFGGNAAIGPGGNISDITYAGNPYQGEYDTVYQDYDGLLVPECNWFDNASLLSMQRQRWYSAAEPLGDGSVAIIGGFVNGGYVNRNYPNVDPTYEGGAAEPTYEFYPSKGEATIMQFMVKTSGLNSYAHSYLMGSGKMLLQANYSTILWDPLTNEETDLPDMPGRIIRVYPASGGVAMLPLTPENDYTPTVIFCGGSDMDDYQWGNYSWPFEDTWNYPASNKCHTLTPEPTDGSAPAYVEDDDMIEGRTMGQFIALPDGTMMIVNGGVNGTAGYSVRTLNVELYGDMPYGMSLASGPATTPAIYNPKAPKGQRWSNKGFDSSSIPRFYHSSALLLPDGSVMIAGSNPNVDVNLTAMYPTEYRAEIFYPSYFSASVRPVPQGIPKTLTYGGVGFDVLIPSTSYSGSANDAADNTTVMLMRPGWTTHGYNMGQRSMQLNNTYTVNSNGSITLHVAQPPPNPNLFQPGPGLVFVTMSGIPSNGTMVIVGNGQVGTQPTSPATVLPVNVRLSNATGSASPSTDNTNQSNGAASLNSGAIVGAVLGAIVAVGILGAIFGIVMTRRRRAASQASFRSGTAPGGAGGMASLGFMQFADSSIFVPLQQDKSSVASQTGFASTSHGDVRSRPSGEFTHAR
ncbi:LanC-like protein 2 [Grifola frondosa]|uniref:LanC-like protein 2 n=1 Tax=Grifola frondosa TaxID=5627 RepID=A0A1C7MKB8_GRIFR|nr:LanC-like protein 2 [Grifola frondosa]